ncbi:MAG TPA: DUF1028 domain-containing protein [Actinomycetota bacterium]|nr:DUF1028 domain-containing protein [Actinomycetota bacterium]
MTFSIAAFDPASASWGVAVASKFLAVGSAVPWGRAGAGAVATQAAANLSYGPDGLDLLAEGMAAGEVIERLTTADRGRDHRQLGVVDARGGAATFTGGACLDWAGGTAGEGFAAQGNVLTGPEVVDAVVAAYQRSAADRVGTAPARALARRLVGALAAGDAAGGDRRGRQSAALRVWKAGAAYGGTLDIAVDLRVDDHHDPVGELARLLDLHELYFGEPDPARLEPLEGELAGQVAACLERLGYPTRGGAGLPGALEAWAGTENFEERLVPGKLDPVVWRQLRRQAGAARDA